MEFWNSHLTEKSWTALQELRKKCNFIIIGGWATYLWTRQQKSKDIDIVVSISELQKFKQENLSKNDSLRKYEIKKEEIDIDIYVEHYSKLTFPVHELKNYKAEVEGFSVVIPEALIILKQGAELDRENSVKGEKDRIDILSILFFSGFSYKKYREILKKYSLEKYIVRLVDIVKNFQDFNAFGLSPRDFKIRKKRILKELK